MQLSPRATPLDANSTCTSVVTSFGRLSSRPTPSWAFIAANVAHVAVALVVVPLGAAVWWKHRTEPRLKHRVMRLAQFIAVGWLWSVVAAPLRNVIRDDAGFPAAPCVLAPIGYLGATIFMGNCYLITVYNGLRRARFAYLARNFDAAGMRNAASSIATADGDKKQEDAHELERTRAVSVTSSARSSSRTRFRVSLRFVLSAALMLDDDFNAVAESSTMAEQRSKLMAVRATLSTRVQLFIFAVFASPVLLFLVGLIAVTPAYRFNCVGCEVFAELLIAQALAFVVFVAAGARIVYVLSTRSLVDQYNLRLETTLLFAWASLLVFLGWVLLAVDANGANRDFVFMFEWFVVWSYGSVWVVTTPLQVWLARKDRAVHAHANGVVMEDKDSRTAELGSGLADACATNPAWLDFAERRLVVESVRFIADVDAWRRLFYDRSPTWRATKAKALVETYVVVDAPLQVNVSERARDAVIAAVSASAHGGGNGVRADAFDAAYDDVFEMIRRGPWLEFHAVAVTKGVVPT